MARMHSVTGSQIRVERDGACWRAPRCQRYSLRASAVAIVSVAGDYGWPAAPRMLRAASDRGRHSLWLGPDEWLLLADDDLFRAARETAMPHSWTEITDRHAALELEGPAPIDWLASACPLDLSAKTFPEMACTRTVLGRCEVLLWRSTSQRLRLECWRSYLPYIEALLRAA